ncbi:MAG TPA: hypothetical protein VK828_05710 [Terriglobales bacterium]|jgi:hypothetical protein|nr:hypothetical protein [Terriglobales bacterium]
MFFETTFFEATFFEVTIISATIVEIFEKTISELSIVRYRKRILEQLERGVAGSVLIVYGEHVETPRARRDVAHEVTRNQNQVPSFGAIDGRLGRFNIARRPRFHFDDAQSVAVPADQIDFPAMMRGAEIPGDNRIASSPKIEIRFFFAAPASPQVRGTLLGRKRFGCNPIEYAQGSLREASSRHLYLQCHPKPDRLEGYVMVVTLRPVQF